MAMIYYIFIGEQSLTNLMGTIKNQICIPKLGLVYRIRVERGSGVTLLLRHNTEAYIVTNYNSSPSSADPDYRLC